MSSTDYIVSLAKESEKEEVIQLIKDYHAPHDPTSVAFTLKYKDVITPEEGKSLNERARDLVLDNSNIIAIHVKTGKVVAAVVLIPYELAESKSTKEYPLTMLPSYTNIHKKIVYVINELYADAKFYEKFSNRKRFINLRSMCVHEDHRGKGLAKALLRKSIEWAKANDCEVLHSCFTLPASTGAAKSVGFKTVAGIDMNELKDSNGEHIVADVSPNNVTYLMAYDVDCDE